MAVWLSFRHNGYGSHGGREGIEREREEREGRGRERTGREGKERRGRSRIRRVMLLNGAMGVVLDEKIINQSLMS